MRSVTYSFWDELMYEQGVAQGPTVEDKGPDYNVGDVLVGEIVEDEPLCINP